MVTFLTQHLGFAIPSPALLEKIGNRFRREVEAFAETHGIPILTLKKPDRTRWDDRKLDHVRPYLDRAEARGHFGVVVIVAAQEYQWVFSAKNRASTPGVVARGSFEALVHDNSGIGRPHEVNAVFGRDRRGATTKQPFRTRVFSVGTEVKMDFSYKHSRVKQSLKEGRALRIETVINKPADLGTLARIAHLDELVEKARGVNDRLLMINVPVRAVPSALRSLSASTSPTQGRANEPGRFASGINAPWPWPAPCVTSSTSSPASPTRAGGRTPTTGPPR